MASSISQSDTSAKDCLLYTSTATAWDHDRDDALPHDNLYHLSDNGTFLKSILLIPYLKRMGINTILMHQPFALSKTQTPHTYAAKECVRSFTDIDETLHDPLVPELNVLEQCLAFIEACHMPVSYTHLDVYKRQPLRTEKHKPCA